MRLLADTRADRVMLITFLLVSISAVVLFLFLIVYMPGKSFQGPLPPLSEPEVQSAHRLHEGVYALSVEIGERNDMHFSALQAAADYLERTLAEHGYHVVRQRFDVHNKEVANLEVVLEGRASQTGTIVIGGHYDSVYGTRGADDNATGSAAVIELAHLLKNRPFRHDVRFVLFVNEEPPHFKTESMGSLIYARELAQQGVNVVAMLSLESIGYFTSVPGSQRYPFPFNVFYPNTGDFIGFVGNLSSRSLVHRLIHAFRNNAHFPSEGVAAPPFIPGVGWSDHWSFWRQGFPAVMVTDTVPFRNPNYHLPSDKIDTLDFEAMARLVHGLAAAIVELDRAEF